MDNFPEKCAQFLNHTIHIYDKFLISIKASDETNYRLKGKVGSINLRIQLWSWVQERMTILDLY